MQRKPILLGVFVFALVGGACGGGAEPAQNAPPAAPRAGATTPTAAPACAPSGTALEITAEEEHFDKDCLAAPANQAFTIEFHNEAKGVPHNVAIKSTSLIKTFFSGKVISGVKSIDYNVPALAAGTYRFRCDVHPSVMKGTFVVS